jgi:biopolymer transport protein ExbD
MRFSRPEDRQFSPGKIRLPLVAMVDVVLFLLLYFLVVGTLDREERHLPSAVTAERPPVSRASDLQPQIVFVETRAGAAVFRIGERIMNDRATLADLLRQLPQESGVVVRVAADVRVEHAAAALQACNDAGFRRISYVPGK